MRRVESEGSSHSLRYVFAQALQRDIEHQLEEIFDEALAYPGDSQWLTEQLQELFGRTRELLPQTTCVQVNNQGDAIIISDHRSRAKLQWKGVWREAHSKETSMAWLVRRISHWFIFQQMFSEHEVYA